MQQQALVPIEKSQAEDVVVDKSKWRIEPAVEPKDGTRLAANHLRCQRRIAPHVFLVDLKRGIGVVDERAAQRAGRSVDLHGFVDSAIFDASRTAAESAAFSGLPKAAELDPAAKKEIAAGEPEREIALSRCRH